MSDKKDGNEGDGKDKLQGLFFKGVVTGRARNYVGEERREVVTYRLLADDVETFVKQWNPGSPEKCFALGEAIDVPVYAKPYMSNNKLGLDIVVRDGKRMRGEEF